MKVKKIITHDYKGLKDGEYPFYERTKLSGQNGSCKTTVVSAYFWVFNDSDYQLNKNPNVIPIGNEEAEPSVTIVADIDGTEVSITKNQKNKHTADGRRSSTNKYMINSVPLTERDFKAKLLSYGIDTDKIASLSNTNTVMGQKAADIKKLLFEMTTSHTDLEIASMDENTAALASALKEYSLEEIIAMNKASKKKADEMIRDIPAKIIGMEDAKINEDISKWMENKTEIEAKIADARKRQKELESADTKDDIRRQLFDVQRKKIDAENDIKKAEREFKRSLAETVLDVRRKINDVDYILSSIDRKVSDAEKELVRQNGIKTDAGKRWRELKKSTFEPFAEPEKLSEDSMICPCCGQELPPKLKQKKIADYEKDCAEKKRQYDIRFELWKGVLDEKLEKTKQEGQAACDAIRECESKMETLASQKERQLVEKRSLERQLEVAQKDEERAFVPEDSMIQLVDSLSERESYLLQLLQTSDNIEQSDEMKAIKNDIYVLNGELEMTMRMIGAIENNANIDKQIANLQNERMSYEQKKATAEMLLYQADLLSKKKNDLMVEEINAHFSIVKWQLFEYQKNGGYKEICVPTIDGYRFGESTNTGREIIAKLDICNSLQKFYGMNVPIFLDNAESLNDFNIPKVDSQLILSVVTDDKELVISDAS